jgi:endonuclease/exonuclease/phosphatase family metal-dependent hydrolase
MIVATLNVRGVGGTSKFVALKRFLEAIKPDVMFIQETMVCESKAREIFVKLLPNWYFCGVDSTRLSGGLLTPWDPRKDDFFAYLTIAGILLDGVVKDLNKRLKLINYYGPYSDREVFWEAIKRDGLLKEQNVIMGGDLNFTTSSREMWGAHIRVDPLHLYFSQLIQGEGMVDVEPLKLLPTWQNGRGGLDYITKRLDWFFISEDLVMSRIRYRTWVCNSKISRPYACDLTCGK